MKRILTFAAAGLFACSLVLVPEYALAKKGGVGKGGGTTDGTFYHSHSSRSYSGKDQYKGKGKALGRNKTKNSNAGGKGKLK